MDKQAKENASALQQVGWVFSVSPRLVYLASTNELLRINRKLAGELQRLRRLMREMPSEELDKAMTAGNKVNDRSEETDEENQAGKVKSQNATKTG